MEGPAEPRPAGELVTWVAAETPNAGLCGPGQAQTTSGHGSVRLERVIEHPVWDSRTDDRLYGAGSAYEP